MTKHLDLPRGVEPGSPEAMEHMAAQIVAHSPQPEVPAVVVEATATPDAEVRLEDDRNSSSLEEIVLGLEIILAAVREMQDND